MSLTWLVETRRCSVCKRRRPLREFGNNGRHYCKLCHALYIFFQRTGLRVTAAEYLALEEAQGGVCAICGQPERRTTQDGVPYALCLDHCHATMKLRGLLCHSCNKALGHFEDSVQGVQRVMSYLAKGL